MHAKHAILLAAVLTGAIRACAERKLKLLMLESVF